MRAVAGCPGNCGAFPSIARDHGRKVSSLPRISQRSGCPRKKPLPQRILRRIGTIVKTAKPSIERHNTIGIVAFEVLVMQVVGEAICIYAAILPDHNLVEPGMTRC